jgi:hypothetical protein
MIRRTGISALLHTVSKCVRAFVLVLRFTCKTALSKMCDAGIEPATSAV